ncbi:hypothetical protein GCM10010371_63970 [Streptomyces subrutilus]|uniref:Uncharacterized protein n=1 Tax=Streptomyces subrutilus TaxID=36818 RepID=A0A918RES6_9ACTN|nr:hypothetical protein [Streptomyces subrutilus]GGZ95226.1 hypothetical protein GCM10010371_63970 [Streptomyces subrutilus]
MKQRRGAALYDQAAAKHNVLVSEVRTAVDYGMGDPEDSVKMACAGAETAEAVVQALSSLWALYTPQDAAGGHLGPRHQLQNSAEALLELRRAVGRIVERDGADLPGPGRGQAAGEPGRRLGDGAI